MHWKRVYYINALKMGLLYKCIGKGFTKGRHWKWVYYINALEKGLLYKCIVKKITLRMN